jgi:hypothetical protein
MKIVSLYFAIFLGALAVATTVANHELSCNIYETFDNMGRDENNIRQRDGLVWEPLCDDFDPVDPYVCPPPSIVAQICAAKLPYESPAVRKAWCIPMMSYFGDEERRDDCIKYCTNYVSADRGGCCNIECP